MATPEEIRNQQELNKELERTAQLEKSLSDFRKGDVDVSFAAVANLREIFGIKSKTRDLDRTIFNNAKAISKQLLGQETSLANIREYTRENLKNEKLLLESITLERAALREVEAIRQGGSEAVKNTLLQAEIRDEYLREEKNLLSEQLSLQRQLNDLQGQEDTEKFQGLLSNLDNIEAGR